MVPNGFLKLLQHLFENLSELEIIGPNHLRIETVKTNPVDPRYGVEPSRCGGELLHSNIPGILKQTRKGVPNSHGYDHRGISYNRLGQTDSSNYPQNYCSCRPKIVKGTHGVTYGIPGNDFKISTKIDARRAIYFEIVKRFLSTRWRAWL